MNGELHINNIIYSDDLSGLDKELSSMSRSLYRGPDFVTLEDELQDSLQKFLHDLGIDEDMATFIENYSLDKDQRLYMDWLKNMKNSL
jgi:complement component 1 Q subcomponent-binding protein